MRWNSYHLLTVMEEQLLPPLILPLQLPEEQISQKQSVLHPLSGKLPRNHRVLCHTAQQILLHN